MKQIFLALFFLVINLAVSQNIRRSLEESELDSSELVQIAIIGSNDIHGTVYPKKITRMDTGQEYEYGGLVYASSLMRIIKEQYKNRVLYLDAGDEFQGGIQSSPLISSGEIMSDFFNKVHLDGSALGNHEFDYSYEYLENYLSKRQAPTIIADVFEDGKSKILPKQSPTHIFQVDGVRIGVIGLVSQETRLGTSGFLNHKFPEYQFPSNQEIVIKHAQRLRSQERADIILILSHIGNYCPRNLTFDVRTNQTQQKQCQNDELSQLLSSLPDGIVDGVVSGHRHQFTHHYFHNIPYMSSINGGYYFNIMHILFNKSTRQIVKTAIQGPVPVCGRIFKNTRRCNYHNQEELKTAGPLVRWKFHKQLVRPDNVLQDILDSKWKNNMAQYFKPMFKTQILLQRDRNQESELANLITTMMALGTEDLLGHTVDFAMVNQGGFRSTWYPGSVTLKQYYSMFAFSDRLKQFQITGKQLKQILEVIQKGQRGFYYFYGLKQTVSYKQQIDPITKNSIVTKQFINATLFDGSQIEDDRVFVGVALDFFIDGGDDFQKVLKGYTDKKTNKTYEPITLKNLTDVGEGRMVVLDELKKLQVITKSQWKANLNDPWMNIIRS